MRHFINRAIVYTNRRMHPWPYFIFLIALMVFLPAAAQIENSEKVLETFDYANSVTAQNAWINSRETPPVKPVVHEGKRGLRISAPFSQGLERTIHDRGVSLDLSPYGDFTLEVFAENPDAVSTVNLYFRTRTGWYGAASRLRQAGWQQIEFNKTAFQAEENPSGWKEITGIRLSVWAAAPVDSALIVRGLTARSHKVVIILPTDESGMSAGDIQIAQRTARTLTKMLKEMGISTDTLEDRMIQAGTLKGRRLAILPLNPNMSPEFANALRRFVDGGGKLFVTYQLTDSVAAFLNLRRTGWMRQERLGQFASIELDALEVAGLPKSVRQASWNITIVEPTDSRTRVIGYWYDNAGKPTGYPALTLGDNGAFFSHTVLSDDWSGKKQLLGAMFGHLVPDIWRDVAKQAMDSVTSVGHLKNWSGITEFFTHAKGGESLSTVETAQELMQGAQTFFAQGAFIKSFDTANAARNMLSEAYLLSHPSPQRESRAVWNHSGTGPYPGDWDRAARELAAAGFNMIFPNMLRAGVAHYPSDVLPRSQTFAEYGDQIAQCVEAAHRYGLEVHVWKVHWNLQYAPDEFVAKMRQAGRTQVSRTGEPINWLCPSHPDNIQLELDSLLEIVRTYDVDGVHFDYIRYPGPDACYCDGCRKRFTAATGKRIHNWPADVLKEGPLKEAYLKWRAEQITHFVRLVHEQARTLRPGLKISAAVFGAYPLCVQNVGQDWVAWARAGYVDFLCPMNYTEDDAYFTRLIKRQLELTKKRVPIYPGIGASASNSMLPPDRVLGQIYLARQAGAPGFTIFDYTINTAGSVIPAVGKSAGATKAAPVHKEK